MLKVLLFNPSSDRLIIKDQYCSFTSKAGYYWIPIDLLVISGQLREDFEVRVFDPNVEKINKAIAKTFDMRPKAIIERLDLLRPIYSETAAYGHFGRTSTTSFSWERLDFIEQLRANL